MAAPTSPGPSAGEPAPAAAAAKPRRLLLILACAAIGVAVLAGGTAAWMLFFRGKPAEAKVEEKKPPHVFRVGTIVVNVAETNGRRYLRTTVELAVADAKEMKRLEERKTPMVDAAIAALGAMPLEKLLDHTHRDDLKTELRQRVNAVVGGEPVQDVFFTEFVIQ
jgi:flagellar basal body-associated protein FliL